MCSDPDQVRPELPNFERVRAEMGRIRAELGRSWPHVCQSWSKVDRTREKWPNPGRNRAGFRRTSPRELVETWPELPRRVVWNRQCVSLIEPKAAPYQGGSADGVSGSAEPVGGCADAVGGPPLPQASAPTPQAARPCRRRGRPYEALLHRLGGGGERVLERSARRKMRARVEPRGGGAAAAMARTPPSSQEEEEDK